ncbi:MAG: hypothetical protein WC485_11695 [Opitutaceae bacterium]
MSAFTHIGRAVTHVERPRFTAVFAPGEMAAPPDQAPSWLTCCATTKIGGAPWHVARLDWLDEPPSPAGETPAAQQKQQIAAVKFFSRLLREAADYFHDHGREDWIQAAVIARAAERSLSAHAIAQATGWAVSDDHVQAYLQRRKSMGSHKLQHVLAVLKLEIVAGTR